MSTDLPTLVLSTRSTPGVADWENAQTLPIPPAGSVNMYAGATAPLGWLLCDGSAVSRATYTDLFAVIGTLYGSGDGSTTFNLPDLRGRTVVGAGSGPGLTPRALTASGGSETVTLGASEIPAHTHTGTTANNGIHNHTGTTALNGSHSHTSNAVGGQGNYGLALADGNNTGDSTDSSPGELNIWTVPGALSINANGQHDHTFTTANAGDHNHTFTSDPTGGGGAHANMQPFLVLNYIIKY